MDNSKPEVYSNGRLSGFVEKQRVGFAARYIPAESSVLDVGCGVGSLLNYLPERVTYVGIDILATSIKRAQARHPGKTFVVADIVNETPELDGTFDAIIMLAFLEHLAEPSRILEKMTPYLKPQGMIIATTPAPWGRQVHNIGAKLGLLSSHAAEEHEDFLGKQALAQLGRAARLEMVEYKRFLLGVNQLVCYKREKAT